MSASEVTTLYLVRHGATDANLQRPYVLQGRGMDLPLSETGRRQAQCVRKLFERMTLAAVYSSPLQRAFDTARAVAEPHRLDVATIEALIEADVGKWEGMSWDQIRRDFPKECEDFQRNQSRFPYFGGESYPDVARRAIPALTDLMDRHPGRSIVAIAHNVVIRACAATYLGMPLTHAKDLNQNNGGVSVLRRENGRTDLITLNSIFHIEEDLRS
jgi:broad specificity phosphatase PhoE